MEVNQNVDVDVNVKAKKTGKEITLLVFVWIFAAICIAATLLILTVTISHVFSTVEDGLGFAIGKMFLLVLYVMFGIGVLIMLIPFSILLAKAHYRKIKPFFYSYIVLLVMTAISFVIVYLY